MSKKILFEINEYCLITGKNISTVRDHFYKNKLQGSYKIGEKIYILCDEVYSLIKDYFLNDPFLNEVEKRNNTEWSFKNKEFKYFLDDLVNVFKEDNLKLDGMNYYVEDNVLFVYELFIESKKELQILELIYPVFKKHNLIHPVSVVVESGTMPYGNKPNTVDIYDYILYIPKA